MLTIHLTPPMRDALNLAVRHGVVWPGRNRTSHGTFRVVGIPTIRALGRFGYLKIETNYDGGMVGRPTALAVTVFDKE